jgi:hypothetical protein
MNSRDVEDENESEVARSIMTSAIPDSRILSVSSATAFNKFNHSLRGKEDQGDTSKGSTS